MPGPENAHQSVDHAARDSRLGQRRAVFRPVSPPRRRPVVVLVPVLVLFGLVVALLASAGLLTSFIGIGFVAVFVVMIGAAVAGMRITASEAKGDQEMHVFDQGVVIRGPKGRVLPYRWDETRLIRHGIRSTGTSARWSYGLLNPRTPPVLMGQTVATGTMIANSEGADLGKLTRVAEFERIDVWGPVLEADIRRAHLPRALDELTAGRSVGFGPATATPEGLKLGRKVLPWADITALTIDGGFLKIKRRGAFFTSSVKANDVPNFVVLAAVVEHFGETSLRT